MDEIKGSQLEKAPALKEKTASGNPQTLIQKQVTAHQHPDFVACQNLADHLDDDQMYYQELMLLD